VLPAQAKSPRLVLTALDLAENGLARAATRTPPSLHSCPSIAGGFPVESPLRLLSRRIGELFKFVRAMLRGGRHETRPPRQTLPRGEILSG
jgi:hypothetical protein